MAILLPISRNKNDYMKAIKVSKKSFNSERLKHQKLLLLNQLIFELKLIEQKEAFAIAQTGKKTLEGFFNVAGT